jgi:hypothetical protein
VNATNTPFTSRGAVNWQQTCHDGDPNCDADRSADGMCHFRVAICLNQVDPNLPACTPGTTSSVHVYPSRKPDVLASNDALLTALEGLGGTPTGHGLTDVSFSPALGGGPCTAFTSLAVPVGTRQKLKIRAFDPSGRTDLDRLRLICSAG